MTTRPQFMAGVAGLLACGAQRAPAVAQGKPLVAGFVPSTLFAPVFVAAERGYFAAADLSVDLNQIVSGQDTLALVATGKFDFIAAGVSAAFFNAVARGLDVKFVASTGYQPQKGHPTALMVREDLYAAGLHDVTGLRGKKIGSIGGAGATSAYYVARILRRVGVKFSEVEMINIANPDLPIAMERKAIDATFVSAPFTDVLQQRKLARIIAGPPTGISGTGIFFGPSLLQNRDAAERVMTACRRGAKEVAGTGYTRRENLEAMAKYTKQPVEELQRSDRYDFDRELRIDQTTLQDMQTEFLAQGLLTYKTPISEVKLVARF